MLLFVAHEKLKRTSLLKLAHLLSEQRLLGVNTLENTLECFRDPHKDVSTYETTLQMMPIFKKN